jgi:hypothetical protein
VPPARASCCALALLLLAPTAAADPTPEDGSTSSVAAGPPAAAPGGGEGGAYVPAGVAFGLAALGLGVGAVAGGLSLSDAHTVESLCHAGVCPPSERGEASTAKLLGNLSTASLIVGGAAALTGLVLLVVLPRHGVSAAKPPRVSASTPAPATHGVAWAAGLGLGRLTLEARF